MWKLSVLAVLLGVATYADVTPKVVYYYSQWSVWGRRFCLSEFFKSGQFKGVTHIQYSFHYPDSSCKIISPDLDPDFGGEWWVQPCETECPGEPADRSERSSDRGNIGCLKKIANELGIQVGISLGGWTLSMHFSECTASESKRKTMIDSLIPQIREYGWSFVDIDWEYPHGGGNDDKDGVMHGTPNDWDYFKTFVTELRARLAAEGLSHIGISGAFGQNPNLIEGTDKYAQPTPMKWLCDNLDYVSTMSYDLMGGWGTQTGWPAPLYHDPAAPYDYADKLTVEWELKTWKEACGDNFHKVVMGLPAYAKSWRSVPAGPTGSGVYEHCSHTGKGPSGFDGMPCLGDGSFEDTAGTLEVWDIEALYLNDSKCKHYFHTVAKQDYVYCENAMHSSNKADQIWFAYDGPEVMYEKVKLAREMGAGGWMFWEASYTALGGETDYGAMVSSKAAALQSIRPSLPTEYFWAPYEDACWAGWNGTPIAALSRGERIPADGSTAPPAASGSTPKCDEVLSASVSDGSVDTGCVASFCTLACNTFMSGDCSAAEDASSCLSHQISNIPPVGMSGFTCSFGTA